MLFFVRHWKKIAVGIAVLAVVGTIFAGYRFVTDLVEQNAEQSRRIGQAETSLATQRASIKAQQRALQDAEEMRERFGLQLQEIADGQIEARAERDRLTELFRSNDFEELLNQKPDTVLRLVNGGTARVNRLLECASGNASTDCADDRDTEALAPFITETGTD